MAIHILCPHCRSPFVLGDELANQIFTCTNCGGLIQLPPAPPPPPIEMIETYEEVVGERPPLILDLLGIFSAWRWDSSTGDVLRLVWSLRYIAIFVLSIVYTFKCMASVDAAMNAAPRFFGVMVVCILWGYLEAVRLARKKDLEENDPPGLWVASLIINPIALVASGFRDTLPAYRPWFLAVVLFFCCLCVSHRAGSLKFLVPQPVRRAIHAAVDRPRIPPVVIEEGPATTEASAPSTTTAPATVPASEPATTPATGPVYRPEDGPPPPPADP
jgi:hypothetical protein